MESGKRFRRLSFVPAIGVSVEVVEECADEVLHAVAGGVVEGRVVRVVLAVAAVGVQVSAQLRGALVDLHGGVLVAVLQVLLELGRRGAHLALELDSGVRSDRLACK